MGEPREWGRQPRSYGYRYGAGLARRMASNSAELLAGAALREDYRASPRCGRGRTPGPKKKAGGNHFANFIKAVRSRRTSDQNGPVETAHLSSALAHLGNIAYRLGRNLEFDPEKERFVGDAEADRLLTRRYRAPYVVPERV